MGKQKLTVAAAMTAAVVTTMLRAEVAKFDSRIAADLTQADTNGVVWVDGRDLPLESKAFAETDGYYGRMPRELAARVSRGVAGMARHATGHYFVFVTDSPTLAVEWVLEEKAGRDPYIPAQGMYGVDIYCKGDAGWRFVKNGRLSRLDDPVNMTAMRLPGGGMRPVIVYLPTRGVVKSIRLGLGKGARLERYRHARGIVKPVVHYGTSIVHGGCASRPGLCFTSIVGRTVDAPYVNLGFSGCACLEIEMAEALARIDASLYIVDPAWNCNAKMVRERCEKFLERLHAAHPETPILLCEGSEPAERLPVNDAVREVYEKIAAGKSSLAKMLHFLPAEGMLQKDGESTHDYCHPNDYGSVQMGAVFSKAVGGILRKEP